MGRPTATWELRVARGAIDDGVERRAAELSDLNGDGFADVAVGANVALATGGEVLVFYGSRSGLAPRPDVTLTGFVEHGGFGTSVAFAGDVNGDGNGDILVGAPEAERAYVYSSTADGVGPENEVLEPPHSGGLFGMAAAGAGDVNGDGLTDVLVGSPARDTSDLSGTGRAYVFLGTPGHGIRDAPVELVAPCVGSSGFGVSASSAGDVNGDGYSDVIVGDWECDASSGRAYVFHGGMHGVSLDPATALRGGGVPNERFGTAVAAAGDLNGDGFGDVIVGAPGAGSLKGRAYVYFGSPAGIDVRRVIPLRGEDGPAELFGISVAGVDDVDSDGLDDVAVGASQARGLSGRVYVFFGSVDVNHMSSTLVDPQGIIGFGTAVHGAGDVNADGFPDIVVGAFADRSYTGSAFLLDGQTAHSGFSGIARIGSSPGGGQFGRSVALGSTYTGPANLE